MKRRRKEFHRPQVGMERLRQEAAAELGIDPSLLGTDPSTHHGDPAPGQAQTGEYPDDADLGGHQPGDLTSRYESDSPDPTTNQEQPQKELYKGMVRRLIRRSLDRPEQTE